MSGKIITLTRHIIEEQRKHPQATGQFTDLMNDIAFAAKLISYHTNKAGLMDVLGETDNINVQGEVVKKLDVFANETIIRALDHNGHTCVMASEESEDVIPIPEEYPAGKYVVLFDPLDGSSNIDANVSVGTIFSIFNRISPDGGPGTLEDCMQPGYKQVCAGYVIYGSSTMLVYTTGNGVYGFTLDPSYGEFILSHPNIRIPKKGKIYSVNESNFDYWDENVKNYIRYIKKIDKATNRPMNSRYIGSMVSDIHRTLLYGGIFMYPASQTAPSGKLRLAYEANPMAFIVEQAGGRASDGKRRILDIIPEKLHQRVPLFIGSEEDVIMAEEFIAGKRTVD
ncbi:MAG TPA: class 1 fructose-bisphosphatase [Caldithrix abyssi]|uniref:Fructose-1,6-bisphosphatase class 1 n=1 Tax=Caldithrix abyssi TaxID=187145 RepID=A0A7V5UFN1_CALAY|nr:class 1 fructose-bisphosphatase [Caldithrix abyssi]